MNTYYTTEAAAKDMLFEGDGGYAVIYVFDDENPDGKFIAEYEV